MSLQGKLVFASGKWGDYDIWTLDLVSGHVLQLTSGDDCWNDAPKWSPNGKQVIFVSNRSGSQEIWVMNEDGSGPRQITDKKRVHFTPAWHPSGKTIVFCSTYKANLDIFTMNIDGTDLRQITDYLGKDSTPTFSPDGKKIVFTSQRSGNDDIWEYDLERKSFTQLTTHAAQDFYPVYSPDGEKIAFVSGRFEEKGVVNLDIFTMDKDGKNKKRITNNTGSDRYAAWSPDARYLIYAVTKFKKPTSRLHVLDLGDLKPAQVKFDRELLDKEIGTEPMAITPLFVFLDATLGKGTPLGRTALGRSFQDFFREKGHAETYFGTERFVDWKL